jgi:hypothetical protein
MLVTHIEYCHYFQSIQLACDRALECIESQAAQLGPEMEKKAKQAEFLQTKAREYRRSVEQLKVQLKQYFCAEC